VKSTVWIGALLLCAVLGAQTPAAPPVAAPAENIENMNSIALYTWLPSGGPQLVGGKLAVDVTAQSIVLPSKPSQANGIVASFKAKGQSRVEVSYFDVKDSGSTIAERNLSFFGSIFAKGDYLSLDYRLRNLKVSWNYLTYPVPPLDSKFRIKTFWEVHYTQMRPVISAPLSTSLLALPVSANERILLPAGGIGFEYVPSPQHFRMEARFSGFGLPGKAAIWDGEGSFVARVKRIEIFAGEKAYHFRTNTGKDIYSQATLWGPYGGIRWVFRQ
jgi:hypothetical protein